MLELLTPLTPMRLLETFSIKSDVNYYFDGDDLGETEDATTIW